MDRYVLDDNVVVSPKPQVDDCYPLKEWRLKLQAGTLNRIDITDFFKKESRKYFTYERNNEAVKCLFKEAGAKEAIIDVLVEFMLGENPTTALEKLHQEGNTASVCGKVFKNGEPTYSCRECGMDPTCVLCINCFKQSEHRLHKYKMSTSGGGGCCDCGDVEAWRKDHYCENHKEVKSNNRMESAVISDAVTERCEIAFKAVLSFCVKYLEIESNASLECLDSNGGTDENYCTVLYNDESHTFDQVIQTLTKIAKCRHKDAMEIVAAIDREGRAVVKCDSFKECYDLKQSIENQLMPTSGLIPNSRPAQSLRTSVLHIDSVACQQFALQLLTWFQEFLVHHIRFRRIFSDLIQVKNEPFCVRHILEFDVKLWKTARTCWHRVLISGMLIEYENKMLLAEEFSRRYATILQDFIYDDHDHSFSIVSLSVQLFTVPSIAHHLIAHEGLFFKLLHTFYNLAIQKYVEYPTLHFSKNVANMAFFKRSAYILYDVRYLLSAKPEIWTSDLRAGFLEGCKSLLRILNVMQGMESMTRQTGQHMDYEPEWECAFNLHIKLASTISQVIEWAASDEMVLDKLYKSAMRSLVHNTFILSNQRTVEKTVAGHVADCLVYDVASRPVSIHLPLSRFFAGVYLQLGIYGMTYDNMSTFDVLTLKLSPRELIEPVLCTQAMIAQVTAGMWRRNGYSLLHQLYFYRNVRCRLEMLDRDIVLLQIGASLMESNQFLIHMLNKFNLINVVQPEYGGSVTEDLPDDDISRLMSVFDEFLELLIVIIGERYVPGVSTIKERERTQKEIIQLLCIKSFSHSELSRALPDCYNDKSIEDIILSVATFKKPSNSDIKGVYELKDELYDDFNLYFYHYTKEDKSKAEETQRERHKNKNELVCCPPPKLPKFAEAFMPIVNILQCDVFFSMVIVVLDRVIQEKTKIVTGNHLQKILHLIGFAIQEEESGNYPFLNFFKCAEKFQVLAKLEELARSKAIEANRDFILWTIKRWKEIVKNATSNLNADEAIQGAEDSPLCAAQQEKIEKEVRSRLAAKHRAKIMEQIKNAQRTFITSNAEMFANTSTSDQQSVNTNEEDSRPSTSTEAGHLMDWQSDQQQQQREEEGAVGYKSTACLGIDRHVPVLEEPTFKCMLCFEDCVLHKNGITPVCSAYVQTSKVLYAGSRVEGNVSMHVGSCGHVMHYNCWEKYYATEESKEQRRPHRSRTSLCNGQNIEFHCPYCRCLSNTILPISEPLSKYSQSLILKSGEDVFQLENWLDIMRTFGNQLDKLGLGEDQDLWFYAFPSCETVLKKTDTPIDMTNFNRMAQTIRKPVLHESWTDVITTYVKSLHITAESYGKTDASEMARLLWESCSYTIRTLEAYLRATNKLLTDEMSIRHESCVSSLVRACSLHAANLTQNGIKNLVRPVSELLETIFKQRGDSVLEWDCFTMMVSTLFMVPNMLFATDLNHAIIANGNMIDFYTLQLFFLAHMTKAILVYEHPIAEESKMEVDLYDEENLAYVKQLPTPVLQKIIGFYSKYNLSVQQQQRQYKEVNHYHVEALHNEKNISEQADFKIEANEETVAALFQHIKNEMNVFLRCCSIFFHFMTDVDFPENLESSLSDNFVNMCKYLGLNPNLDIYFEEGSVYIKQLEAFASHPDIILYDFNKKMKLNGKPLIIEPCVRPLPEMARLPEDYSELINSVPNFICPNNEREEMKSPTMCLICGNIICGQSYCCQPELGNHTVGACTYHAHHCGAEAGMFLRIRDCQIVYLGRGKGCFVQPPYFDEYGETDQGLRRGNPLHLCRIAYRKIYLQWLNHSLHEEIARLNDHTNITVTQWHHM